MKAEELREREEQAWGRCRVKERERANSVRERMGVRCKVVRRKQAVRSSRRPGREERGAEEQQLAAHQGAAQGSGCSSSQ